MLGNRIRLIGCLFFCVIITSCGWHLRGAVELPEDMRDLLVQPNEPYTPLQRRLRLLLRISGVNALSSDMLVNTDSRPNTLYLTHDEFSTAPATIGTDGEIKEQNVTYTVRFYLTDHHDKRIMPEQEIVLSKTTFYDTNSNRLTANDDQSRAESQLRDEMANQMLRRIARTLKGLDDDYELDQATRLDLTQEALKAREIAKAKARKKAQALRKRENLDANQTR